EQRKVAAKQVARGPDRSGPRQPAERAEQLKAPEGHACHAGQHRGPGAQAENKARNEDRLVAVARKKQLGAREVVGPDVEDAAEPLDKRSASAVTEQVTEIGSRRGAEKAEKDDERDRVMSSRGPRGGRKQQRLAWKGNARAFDEDAQPGGRVTKRIDDQSPIHGVHILDDPMSDYGDHESSDD